MLNQLKTSIARGILDAAGTLRAISALTAGQRLRALAAGTIGGETPNASGLDDARPAASADLVGTFYYATDTLAVYYCINATTWVAASSLFGSDKSSLGPFSANTGLYCAASQVVQPQGTSGVLLFYPTATPSGTEVIADCRDSGAGTRGWSINCGGLTDKAQLQMVLVGITGAVTPTGATFAGLLNTLHGFAWAITGGNLRTSFDGAPVQVTALGAGAYVPGNVGDRIVLGMAVTGSYPHPSGRIAALKTYTNVVADADLRVLSGAATLASFRPPTQGGTVDFDFNSSRHPAGAASSMHSGERLVVGNGGSPYLVRKWAH